MNILYNDGAVTVFDKLSGDNEYDVGNKLINARFDGRGGVSRYAVINKFEALDYLHTLFSIDGIPLNFSEDKTVTVIGKKMTVKLRAKKADIEIRQFLSEDDNAVFIKLIVSAIEDISFKAVVNFGVNYKSYMQEFFLSRFSVTGLLKAASGMLKKHIGITKHEIKNDITGDFYIDFASDNELIPLESNFMFVNQFKTETYIKSREARVINVVMSSGTRNDFSAVKASELLKKIDEAEREADDYISSLKRYPEDVSEKEKALYASCLNCALSNYKEKGRFKGFLAGLVYQFPARTYFRDGYWTCLPVIAVRPEAVRNQILTLSKGMGRNGECPSAVKSSFKKYWGDHCDSPSFFTLLLYDYVAHTGDFSILQEKAGRDTVLSVAVKAVERLSEQTDDTGLIVKSGQFNRRDWCDNVFRTGYVTYDEALYARALYCLSGIFSKLSDPRSAPYRQKYEKVKKSINDILWSEEKGYFVNYKNGGFVEDNLSIDTVLIALFNLSEPERIRRMLKNMEDILESKNNTEQTAGDFGVLCVYPFYRDAEAVVQKSSQPYRYHNGADWPYLSAAYAYAKMKYSMDFEYPLTRWFDYNIQKGNLTPIEFFAPFHAGGSLMQAWSAMSALLYNHPKGDFFDVGVNQDSGIKSIYD